MNIWRLLLAWLCLLRACSSPFANLQTPTAICIANRPTLQSTSFTENRFLEHGRLRCCARPTFQLQMAFPTFCKVCGRSSVRFRYKANHISEACSTCISFHEPHLSTHGAESAAASALGSTRPLLHLAPSISALRRRMNDPRGFCVISQADHAASCTLQANSPSIPGRPILSV